MVAEIGLFSLIAAFAVFIGQAGASLIGAYCRDARWMAAGRNGALFGAILTAFAFAALAFCYAVSDFSVLNVAENSHSAKPLLYKITGVWGNHEGSMLLWTTVLAVFCGALALFRGGLGETFHARALAAQGGLSACFLSFTLFVSNPFARLDPPAPEGLGMNPMLQDPGLAFHPPFLYLGYVGFSVAFSFAIAALIEGRIGADFARALRFWVLLAWLFLTIGVGIGCWWAFYTLGWGGWWYWDPVENASLAPWLAGTALLHVLIVTERRGALKGWGVLLAILVFSLSLLGTFLVRSGVLTSVHSFASDPARGLFILALLGVLSGLSLLLFAMRAASLGEGGLFRPVSKEGFLLFGSVFLVAAAGMVLFGTLYPIFIEALALGKISVGAPFFNKTILPLLAPMAVIMAIGPMLRSRDGALAPVLKRLAPAGVLALLGFGLGWALCETAGMGAAVGAGFALALWLGAGTVLDFKGRIGMKIAHIGLAVMIAGMAGDAGWSSEKSEVMREGDRIAISGYEATLEKIDADIVGPNYLATRAILSVRRQGTAESGAFLTPEIRRFIAPPRPFSHTSIHAGFFGDFYAALGQPDGKGGWTIRIYRHFLTPWIFAGGGLMALGGFWSLVARRIKRKRAA